MTHTNPTLSTVYLYIFKVNGSTLYNCNYDINYHILRFNHISYSTLDITIRVKVVNQHLRRQISQKPGWIGLGTYRWWCDHIDVFRLGHSPDCRRFNFTIHVLSFWSVLIYDIRRIWRCYIDHIKRSVHLYVRRDEAWLVDKLNNCTSRN